jgi:predicted type IV restriction endonuclease
MDEPMAAPAKIQELIERYERHLDSYKHGNYNETQLRREFLDPFFKALSWDVGNEQGYAEAYKDVVHEDTIKIAGHTKAPDYSFRIGGVRKFFVEAKKPAINIQEDAAAAYQLRRYAWSAKLPLSILTNFEYFQVYDCRSKPDKADKASHSRILSLKYSEYPERWEELAGVFSREAVLKGSFDKYVESKKAKKGTAEVDAAFLQEIERWRELLARNLALRNPGLSQRQLNYSVQLTIDRIIFLRICEDRGLEDYAGLMALLNGQNIYQRLFAMFYRADDRYNSGLFHFQREKGRASQVDDLTPQLIIDDKVLKDIFKNLYYPDSPYEFAVLPADILGQVYEQFLGKVIRLTPGHRAVVEYKPEVRKAGGVYYTPTYIVDYIVRQTVGKLLEGKEPGPRSPLSKLRILDPACGSGSFLLGAYQFLLDWHLEAYAQDHGKWTKGRSPRIIQVEGGVYKLTIAERKRLLLDHIYGVDIDAQAVEVTKLSLLLKVLEGEDQRSLARQLPMFAKRERALPDLGANIKCGNSLIGPDFYQGRQTSLLDDEETYRINAFDWPAEFPEIMTQGGFDAVIGNPPYLFSAGKDKIEYFNSHYNLAEYQTDFYVYFIEKGLTLCKKGGILCFIVSDSWLNSMYFSIMRKHILGRHQINFIAVFDYPVFHGVALENSIISVLKDVTPMPFCINLFMQPNNYSTINTIHPESAISIGIIDPHFSPEKTLLIKKIEEAGEPIEKFTIINRGLHAYRIDGYGKSKYSTGYQTIKDKDSQSYHADHPIDETYLPEIKGKQVFSYYYIKSGKYLSYGPWLAEPREPIFFYNPKIVLRKTLSPKKLYGTLIIEPCAIDQSLYILVAKKENDLNSLKYLLGILSSRLGNWFLRVKYSIFDKIHPWYTKKQLANFPIIPRTVINKARHDRLAALVEKMLAWNKELAAAQTPQEKTALERRITAADKEIDRLVYDLYGLSEEEINLVEGR